MRQNPFLVRFLAPCLCWFVLVPSLVSAQTPDPAELKIPVTNEYRTKIEREAFLLVNQYRQSNKLLPLTWNAAISDVARGHSKDMANGTVGFGHEGFKGRVTVLKKELSGLVGAGENVLKTDDPNEVAKKAVAIWLKSPPHHHNIVGDFNCAGMGVWIDSQGMIYFTQVFVKLLPKTEPTPTPAPVSTSLLNLLAPAKSKP